MKSIPRAAVAVLSLALAACADNPFSGGRLPVRFTLTGPTAFAAESPTPRTVAVRGTFGLGGCDTPDPEARVEGNTVVFRLEMKQSSGACPDILTVRGYQAEISGVDAGTWQVRVEHVGTNDDYDGVDRPDGVRFQGTVTVQ